MIDLMIKNGRIYDPGQKLDFIGDIAVHKGKIVDMGPDLPMEPERTVNAKGFYVVPGLIDVHTHINWLGNYIGMPADLACIPMGVTATIDAGSSGVSNYRSLLRYMDTCEMKTKIMLHASAASYGVAKDYMEAGLFTCLGFPGPEPSEVLPGIKTFKEQGIDVEFAPQDFSFYFPKETPDEVIAAYEAATQKMLQNEDCIKALSNLGQVPRYMSAEEARENEEKLYKQFKELSDSLK